MIVLDAHVHLHPGHDAAAALAALAANLGAHARRALVPGAPCVALLAERAGEHLFRNWLNAAAVSPAPPVAARVSARLPIRDPLSAIPSFLPAPDGGAIEVRLAGATLWLIPGRQVATRERLEVLAAGVDAAIPDGLPMADTLAAVRDAGAIPILPWGVGKWWGTRGRIVRELLDGHPAGALLVCDSAVRPIGWPLPRLLRRAHHRGLAVLAGTDVLPVPGDAGRGGRYATLVDAAFDPAQPAASIRRALAAPAAAFRRTGRRLSPWGFAQRWRVDTGVTAANA